MSIRAKGRGVDQTEPVLVTWGESRMALAATRALGRAGVSVSVLAEQPWAPAWRSRYCIDAVEAPDADRGESYLEFIETLVRGRRYSGVFFCDDRSALLIGRERQRFLPLVPLLLPEQRLLELTVDKRAMMDFACANGIPVPRSAFPRNAGDIDSVIAGMRYPLLVKGSGGFASRRLRVVDTSAKVRQAFDELSDMQASDGYLEPAHLQEYVSGPIFSVLALCRHGEVVALFMMRKRRTFPVWGGVSVEAESVQDTGLEAAARRLLDKLPWHGIIEMEFVRDDRDGRYLLIEPSPDPNWGLDLAVAAGLNIPYLAWRIMQGLPLSSERLCYRVGKRFLWYLPEGVRYLLERPMAILPMLLRTLDPRSGCDLRQRDFRPVISQVRATWWAIRSDA